MATAELGLFQTAVHGLDIYDAYFLAAVDGEVLLRANLMVAGLRSSVNSLH